MIENPHLEASERKNTFVGEIPEAPLRDQIPKKLAKKLEELNVAQAVVEMWNLGNANRVEWLDNQEKLIKEFEEFIAPIYQGAYAWSSTMHLPVTYTLCRTFHSRMLAALLNFDPPFTVAARSEAQSDRAPLIQDFMRYMIKDYANEYKGIDEVLDRWVWNWVTSGRGILKYRWDRKYSRFVDVVQVPRPGPIQFAPGPDGQDVAIPTQVMVDEEQEVVIPCFIGPKVEICMPEDVLVIGGDGDVDAADAVIEQLFLTQGDLWQLVDQKIFDKEAVDLIISGGPDLKSSDTTGIIKQARMETNQQGSLNSPEEEDRYRILEAYIKRDVDGSGIPSDLIVWVGAKSRAQLRATYLRRMSKSGKRPYATIDFHRRTSTQNPVGLVELVYSLQKEMDTIHNMRVDFGLLSTLPFGFYRANSSMAQEKIPLEPGAMIPIDNPQADVFFPNLGNRTSFGFQEEQALYSYVERMTSVSDLSLGVLGAQGSSRTATGARITASENNSNLDVYMKRLNRGFKKLLHGIFELLQDRVEPGLQFRVIGEDGDAYWSTVKSRDEIAGSYDFELEGSSAASNRGIQLDTASQVYQATQNVLDIQLGLITPAERFEAIKNYYQALGVKSWSKFVRKPDGAIHRYTPEEAVNRVLAGRPVKLDPTQDLQGIIEYIEHIKEHDELLGQFKEDAAIQMHNFQLQAASMLQATQEAASANRNASQMQTNAAMSQSQANTGMAAPGTPGMV